jgi:Icc-related predicted phosphoesterase
MDRDIVRVAAVGDIHCNKNSAGMIAPHFARINEEADILVLCGDLTDYGTPEEAHILVKELSGVRIPMVGVLGNHDFETNQAEEVTRIFAEAGITILDGDTCEILGIGFAGTKGYMGGFGRYTLGAWGEQGIKNIVNEALAEALKLESALARLRSTHQIVVLHYSPIVATVHGEPVEIYPFLGSSRLEEPLLRHPVSAVFHGHVHKGSLEGALLSGKPVFNVAMPLLRANFPNNAPYRIMEFSVAEPANLTAR